MRFEYLLCMYMASEKHGHFFKSMFFVYNIFFIKYIVFLYIVCYTIFIVNFEGGNMIDFTKCTEVLNSYKGSEKKKNKGKW